MSAPKTAVLGLSIDMAGEDPAYVQIFSQMREMILAGRLEPGERLPSTRAFAEELGVSRTTLVTAYDHLLSEGYIETRHGAGAFVAAYSPEQLLTATHGQTPPEPVAHQSRIRKPKAPIPFDAGVRDYETFPHAQWARLLQKHARKPPVDFMTDQDPAGEWALREAIADHLRVWRGLSCSAEQIFVTSGGVDAADLVLRCVAVPGGTAFLEDPGYGGTRRVVQEFGLNVDFRPVDEEGMMLPVEEGADLEGAVALVTPSRQFPLGLTKSLSRRLALIDWAARHNAWIMEDDYDSEFRYAGRPLAAMMSLDETGRVIYVGSFSNTMFKGLRLGFAVVPPGLVERMQKVLAARGTNASTIAQLALAEFMSSGQFATHARRLRRLYGRRRAVLREELISQCDEYLEVENTPSGMNLLVNLKEGACADLGDIALTEKLRDAGVSVSPLSRHYVKFKPRQGFVLGYAGFNEEAIRESVKTLASILREAG